MIGSRGDVERWTCIAMSQCRVECVAPCVVQERRVSAASSQGDATTRSGPDSDNDGTRLVLHMLHCKRLAPLSQYDLSFKYDLSLT